MNIYNHKEIESKWQKIWKETGLYKTEDHPVDEAFSEESKEARSSRGKCYVLDMFPYPSGEGLHVGHPKGYIATDVYSRFKKMKGFNILHPMGWDAFGLPAENYAIKNKVHPKAAVEKNIKRYKEQLSILGFNYDWEREINTTDPDYYRWTQWFFLKFLEKGLAYESYEPINWCPVDKTGLANEDIEDGKCERCGTPVEKKPMRQWVLRITDYAEKLLKDLDLLDWPESIKESQRNWIGRSEGVNFKCVIKDLGIKVEMYNSVPQTYRAETFTVIAPEHPLVLELIRETSYEKPVLEFIEKLKKRKAGNSYDSEKEMEGIFTGRYIESFAGTSRDLPIWVASYVVLDYGTGIVNASAHDARDFAFAKKYNIPLHPVVEPLVVSTTGVDAVKKTEPFVERNAVVCVIKHWKENKYLCHSLKINDWKGFVVGGIEEDENPIQAGVREITEETGYRNPEFEKQLGGIVHSQFYQSIKKQNRFAHFTPILFKLKDGERLDVSEVEKKFYDLHWLTPDEVTEFVNRDDMRIIWERARGIERSVIKNGILTEPEEFKGREWNEVRTDIIEYLVKDNFAARKVNYKLRDWVFSRQRYWGEPIPVIHCENCGKGTCLIIHGISGSSKENWFPWLKKSLETQNWKVFAPDLPNTDHAQVKEWTTVLKEYSLSENSIIVGHSVGVPMALHLVQTVGKKIDTLVMVAPVNPDQPFEELKKIEPDLDWDAVSSFARSKFDWEKISSLVNEIVFYYSDNDKYIPADSVEFYKKHLPQATFKRIPGKGHFNTSSGVSEFSEILSEFNKKQSAVIPVPEKDLPVKLPQVGSYEPTDTGESPLANMHKWVNVRCPTCGGPAKRETNTMPQWAGSSWYYLAYASHETLFPKSDVRSQLSNVSLDYWLPVDTYVGGAEHATRHLIYARFWHKFLFDLKLVNCPEPFQKLRHVGLIGGADGRKMSKRFGNVVNPDEMVELYGADTFRLYEMFMGPFTESIPWNTEGMIGPRRFLERVWRMQDRVKEGIADKKNITLLINKTIKKVGEDIENFKFNTAVSSLMIFQNEGEKEEVISKETYLLFIRILYPFAPHVAEEIWSLFGNPHSIYKSSWPKFDTESLVEKTKTIMIQVNGKVRGSFTTDTEVLEEEMEKLAMAQSDVKRWIEGKKIRKIIIIKEKMVSIVTEG